MSLRIRKKIGPVTLGRRSASARAARLGGAGATVGTRGLFGSLRVAPGVTLWKRWR